MEHPLLEFRLRVSYPEFELSVDARFPPGVTAIFGPSGSGKTTILNCIGGLASPDEGEVWLAGRALFSSSERINRPPESRRIGYMFQEGLLFPHRSVRDNILFGYRLTPPEQRKVAPDQVVELLELGPLMDRRPSTLSAGERQRVALARSLATSPALLLMDEPLSSLDLGLRGRILRYLKEVHRSLEMPMVYVSHSISEVLAIADNALVISQGRQLAFDQPHRVLLAPFVHSLAEASGLENLVDVQVMEQGAHNSLTAASLGGITLWVPGLPPQTRSGETVSIAIRAGDIIVAVDRPERISARNILPARIDGIHRVGNTVLLFADVGTQMLVEITPEARDALELHEGQQVHLVIKSNSIMVLG